MSENGHEPPSQHRHEWELLTRMKGCHSWKSVYNCKSCTARLMTFGEHSGKYDPEFPFAKEGCARCAALAEGAEPRYELSVIER